MPRGVSAELSGFGTAADGPAFLGSVFSSFTELDVKMLCPRRAPVSPLRIALGRLVTAPGYSMSFSSLRFAVRCVFRGPYPYPSPPTPCPLSLPALLEMEFCCGR